MSKKNTPAVKERDPKKIFPNCRERLQFAFELDGIDYYEFADINAIPCERGFGLLLIFREMSMKCDTEFLKAHWKAKEAIYNSKELKLTELMKLDFQLNERVEFVIEPLIAYKLCAGYFFDATENPYVMDWKYINEKSKRFMKQKMSDFFLQKPIVKLIPYIQDLGSDLQDFFQTAILITEKHLEQIGISLSEANRNSTSYSWIASELQKISQLKKSEAWTYTPTSLSSNQFSPQTTTTT